MRYLFIVLVGLISCDIETEVIENSPDVNKEIKISSNNEIISELSIMVGQTHQLNAMYSENGNLIEQELDIDWTSDSDQIIGVNSSGVIDAKTVGQTYINASFKSVTAKVLVTVVETDASVARVEILPLSTNMYSPGETAQLSANVYNLSNVELTGKSITWSSSNTNVCTVSSSGLVTFVEDGVAEIRAFSESVGSMPLELTVAEMVSSKSGLFIGLTGHTVRGEVTVTQSGSNLIVTFSENFVSQSGPNLFVTLASNQGSYSNSDKEVASLNGNLSGARTYTVPNVDINTYRYIHIWCKPFNVVFGSAELK